MKKRLSAITTVLLLLLLLVSAQSAFSLSGWHDKGNDMAAPDWPQGLKELVGRDDQVGGFWMNSQYDSYHFDGDTAGANEFLEQYSTLKGVTHTLVLHGGLPASERLSGAPGSKQSSFYEWTLNIVNTERLRRNIDKIDEPDTLAQPQYSVTVHLWLGGRVNLRSLKVPHNIEVKSGGEIEQFITEHKAQQAQR